MFTVLYARLRPYTPQIGLRLIGLHLQIYTQYICIHTTAHIYLYMLNYTYICLHTTSFIYPLLSFTYFYTQGLLSPHSTIYFNAHIRILRILPYLLLLSIIYIITFVYAPVRPIHVYTHIRIYTTQTCLHSSTVMHAVYMFTYYRAHVLIYDNITSALLYRY